MKEEKQEGHSKDGTYVLPLHPVNEAVKVALGLPIRYLFATKVGNRIFYQARRVR